MEAKDKKVRRRYLLQYILTGFPRSGKIRGKSTFFFQVGEKSGSFTFAGRKVEEEDSLLVKYWSLLCKVLSWVVSENLFVVGEFFFIPVSDNPD